MWRGVKVGRVKRVLHAYGWKWGQVHKEHKWLYINRKRRESVNGENIEMVLLWKLVLR